MTVSHATDVLADEARDEALRRLAAEHGTPLYAYDGEALSRHIGHVRAALSPAVDILYSLKANPNKALVRRIAEHGFGAEVSSLVELETALVAGVDPDDIIFVGPGKSDEELRRSLDAGIYRIVCDSEDEIDRLAVLARGAEVRVMLRVNPKFSGSGGGLTMGGGKPKQFGVDQGEALALALRAESLGVRVDGLHVYLGTRYLDHTSVLENTRNILDLAISLRGEGVAIETVDVGGGLGVPYFANESFFEFDVFAREFNSVVDSFRTENPQVRILMEMGRYLVAQAGYLLVKVVSVKESYGTRFAVCDGGTNVNLAAVGVGSFLKRNFPAHVLGKQGDEEPVTVAGPLCTPDDVVLKDAVLPRLEPGDVVALHRVGAYGLTASPGLFLSHGFAAEAYFDADGGGLIRGRDTVRDLLSRQEFIR